MSGWILTKDRLPEKDGIYLTATKVYSDIIRYEVLPFEKVGKKKRRKAFFYYNYELIRREQHPDAWMPIEPYEAGKGEENESRQDSNHDNRNRH